VQSKQFKLLSAAVGGSAVLTMAVLSVGLGHDQSRTGTVVSDPTATLGETVTTTTPPSKPETSQATPPFTFTTPSGFATPH
jgi:hypothetical protein